MENLEIMETAVSKDVVDTGNHCGETAAVLGIGAVIGVVLWDGLIKPLWRLGTKAYKDYRNRGEKPAPKTDKVPDETTEG